MTNRFAFIILLFIFLCPAVSHNVNRAVFCSTGIKSYCISPLSISLPTVYAEEAQDKLEYKLAVLNAKAEDPQSALLNAAVEPNEAMVSEFHWILDGLKNRCLNPETTIADTMVQIWQTVKGRGARLSLLETARELSQTARNRVLFGDERVNFRMTSAYWLNQFQKKEDAQTPK